MSGFSKILCKLPGWLGGGHKWRRANKAEREGTTLANCMAVNPGYRIYSGYRICRRCGAERIVRARKVKEPAA